MKKEKIITIVTSNETLKVTYSQRRTYKGYTFYIHRPNDPDKIDQPTPFNQHTKHWTVTESITGRRLTGLYFKTRKEAEEEAIYKIDQHIDEMPALINKHALEGNPNENA